MLIKKEFWCSTAHVCLVNNKEPGRHGIKTPWGILVTSCNTNIGQKMLEYNEYNIAIKTYNFLMTLTGGIEKVSPAEKGIPGESIQGTYKTHKNVC